MQLSLASVFAALAGSAALVAAADDSLVVQDTGGNTILHYASQVPVCANLCLFQAAVAVGCDTDDYHCQCAPSKKAQLRALTLNCLAKSCSPQQGQDALALTSTICKAVKRGLPVVRRNAFPAPVPEITPAPRAVFPHAAFPPPAAALEVRTVGSSIPNTVISPPTGTASPSSVSTAGAALHKAPAAAMAAVVAVAGALLL